MAENVLAVLAVERKGESASVQERMLPQFQFCPVPLGSAPKMEGDERERQNNRQMRLKMQNQAK